MPPPDPRSVVGPRGEVVPPVARPPRPRPRFEADAASHPNDTVAARPQAAQADATAEFEAGETVPRLARVHQDRAGLPMTRRVVGMSVASVFKLSLAIYLAVMVVVLALGIVFWSTLGAVGAIENFEGFVGELLGYEDFRFLGFRILQIFVLVGLLWVIIAALVTTGLAFLFNRASHLLGGVEVTFDND